MSNNIFPIPPELLRIWPDVKALYSKVVDNAYSHPDDRETAHNVLLRLVASCADLLLKDDPQVTHVIARLSGVGATTTDSDSSLNTTATDDDRNRNLNDQPTEEQDSSSPLDHLDLASLAGLVGLNGGVGPTGPSMNPQELQQMFSFMAPGILAGLESANRMDPAEQPRRRTDDSLHTDLRYQDEYFDD